MNPRLALALRIVVIGAVLAGLYWFVRTIDWDKLGDALAGAKLWPIAIAAVINFACLWFKAACWRVMLAPRHDVSTSRLFRYTIAAYAASVIAPARAGEALRLWTLWRRDNVPVADSTAVAVGEKVLDGVSMVMLVAPVPWLLPGLPGWVGTAILVTAAVALGFFIAMYVASSLANPAATSWFGRFFAGMNIVRSPARLVQAILALMGSWLADMAMVLLVLYAVGIDQPIAASVFILFAINLVIALPTTPAGVGAFEIGAIAATDVLGVDRAPALAFAIIYHVLQVLPLLIVGLAIEMRLVLGREPAAPPPEIAS